MQLTIRKTSLQIDLSSAIVAVFILVWSTYYYYSTLTETVEGPETVLFIRPVFIGILISFPFVIWQAVSIRPKSGSTENDYIDREKPDNGSLSLGQVLALKKGLKTQDRGFLERNRIFFALASAAYCIALPYLGYLIPSVLYVMGCCYFLGSRNIWILLALPIGLSGLMSAVFKVLLSVPIPIWPIW